MVMKDHTTPPCGDQEKSCHRYDELPRLDGPSIVDLFHGRSCASKLRRGGKKNRLSSSFILQKFMVDICLYMVYICLYLNINDLFCKKFYLVNPRPKIDSNASKQIHTKLPMVLGDVLFTQKGGGGRGKFGAKDLSSHPGSNTQFR